MIGNNLQQNFGKNSLKKDQILFLHAGDSEVLEGENGQRISQLLLRSNQHLPEPEPLQIIFKKNESSSIITSLTTTSLEEIKSLIDSGDKIDLVDKIYNLITDNISEQRASVLKQLEDIPQKSKDIINAELERLGFVDLGEDNHEVKEILVKQHITKMLITPRYFDSPDIVSNLELFLQPDLFDIDHQLYDNHDENPTFIIAQKGNAEALEVLAKYGADLNKARDDGVTPAFIAAQKGHIKALKVLAKYGADLNKVRDDGTTPTYIAAQDGHAEALKVLAKYGADLNKARDNGETPTLIAAEEGNAETLEVLAENGADLNKAKNDGTTPAFMAAQNGHAEALEVLAEDGADLNKARDDGVTPAFIAAQKGNAEALKVLAKHGANLNKAKNDGTTPAFMAAQKGNIEALEVLAKYGADLNKPENDGTTPAFMAAQNENVEALEVLAKYGANLNKARNDGATPLIIAINSYKTSKTENFKDVIIFLVENGADPELKTPFGSPYKFSSDEDLNQEIAKARKEYLDKNPPKTSVKDSEVKKFHLRGSKKHDL